MACRCTHMSRKTWIRMPRQIQLLENKNSSCGFTNQLRSMKINGGINMKKKPVVAVVGRPNVGKSTLFNVLAGDMISIVKDTPGVTRDRIYADCTWLDHSFTLIDTGGIEPDTKDIILSQMREQAEIAIATAEMVLPSYRPLATAKEGACE